MLPVLLVAAAGFLVSGCFKAKPAPPQKVNPPWAIFDIIDLDKIERGDKFFNDIQKAFLAKLAEDENLRQQQKAGTSDQRPTKLDVYRAKDNPMFWAVSSRKIDVLGFTTVTGIEKSRELSIYARKNSNPAATIEERIQLIRHHPTTWWHGSGSSINLGAVVYTNVPDKSGKIDESKDVVISIIEKSKIESFLIIYGSSSSPD